MKLLTHNMLASNVKGVRTGFPLAIRAARVEQLEEEFDADFALRMLARIDYAALAGAAAQLGLALPPALPADPAADAAFLHALHHALVNVEVVEGELVCPETGRVFPIVAGVPNMLLREDEV